MSFSSADEQRWNELQLTAQNLDAQDEELVRRAAGLSGIMREAQAAAATLRAFEDAAAAAAPPARGSEGAAPAVPYLPTPGESDSLVPLGLGVYARARISYGTGVVISIGAGAAVEKGTGDALNYVDARIKEVEVATQDTNAMRAEVSRQAVQVQHELEAIMRKAAGGAGAAAHAGRPPEGRA